MSDGGYYAIKGFSFQIDKAILELLNTTNENNSISIEQIQDINDNDFVMQVKYKETQDYSENKIKEPLVQLIEEFQRCPTKDYKLYCYFKNKTVSEETVTLNKLNSILSLSTGKTLVGKSINSRIIAIDAATKKRFIRNFKLIFAPSFGSQFDQVITKLKCLQFVGGSDDIAIFYYSNITDYLKRIVVNNPNPLKRACTRKKVLDYLKNGKKLIFNASYEEYKGKQAFFSFIKTKFIKANKNQKNLIVLGDVEFDSSVSLGKLITDIVERYFRKATYDIEPLVFILPDRFISDVKKDILGNDISYNDGYEPIKFNERIFQQHPIKTRKTMGSKPSDSLDKIAFKIRILSKKQFDTIKNHMQYQMIYYFNSEIIEEFSLCSFQKYDNLNTKQISEIFTL